MSNELAIGEIGVIDGVRVQCCKQTEEVCKPCVFFNHYGDCDVNAICFHSNRSDHTDVYFKKIEE